MSRRAWLEAQHLEVLRGMADGMPNRWHATKAEVVQWLLADQGGPT